MWSHLRRRAVIVLVAAGLAVAAPVAVAAVSAAGGAAGTGQVTAQWMPNGYCC